MTRWLSPHSTGYFKKWKRVSSGWQGKVRHRKNRPGVEGSSSNTSIKQSLRKGTVQECTYTTLSEISAWWKTSRWTLQWLKPPLAWNTDLCLLSLRPLRSAPKLMWLLWTPNWMRLSLHYITCLNDSRRRPKPSRNNRVTVDSIEETHWNIRKNGYDQLENTNYNRMCLFIFLSSLASILASSSSSSFLLLKNEC